MQRWKEVWPWALAIAALLILAVSQVEFVPEKDRPASFNPLGMFQQPGPIVSEPRPVPQSAPTSADLDAAISRLFLWVLLPIAVGMYVIAIVISPRTRRHAMAVLGTLLLAIALVTILMAQRSGMLSQGSEQAEGAVPAGSGSLPDIAPIQPSGWVVWLAAFMLALALLGGSYLLWRWLRRRMGRSLAQLAEQAQSALQELQAGADLRDVVTRCYAEMSRIVSEQRGLRRRESLTPREFARKLVEAGLPASDVHRLTQLFERVRYADQAPGPFEEREATACLEAVVAAVGRMG